MIKRTLIIAMLFAANLAQAKVAMPSFFTDNMVFQQKSHAVIWGKAGPGKRVVITAGWAKSKYNATADAAGNWKISIPTPAYGGPYSVIISDGDVTTLNNVLIGDVWLCSGQSNMEMPLAGWGKIKDYEKEIAAADYPNIRLLQVKQVTSNLPVGDAKIANGGWQPCSPASVAEFSSVAYFFAREIYRKTKVPIGLINSSWAGTYAEAWTSGSALKQMPEFTGPVTEIEQEQAKDADKNYADKLQKWKELLPKKDSGYNNGVPQWLLKQSDSLQWRAMQLPSYLEQALPNFDGVVWLKKKIIIPANWAGKSLKLSLGTVDDADITWFNGDKVGETALYSENRLYTIPGNLVKAGENIIDIRVFDSSGSGGIYGSANLLHLTNSDGEQIPLNSSWQYRVGMNFKSMPPYPAAPNSPNRPSVLFNAMINPFIQFPIKGVLWYQGESNTERAYRYRTLFPTMITNWRAKWHIGDFPFYYVQLANFYKTEPLPGPSDWAELREAQLMTLALPNTGMAMAIDIGGYDIHPKNKQEVGRRLALVALAKNYGGKTEYSGPLYKQQSISRNKIALSFSHANGLMSPAGQALTGFAIAGSDQKFYWADAVIVGDKVVVSSTQVGSPVAVRYAWGINPVCNLYNGVGLPASPFRTDEWEGVTFDKK